MKILALLTPNGSTKTVAEKLEAEGFPAFKITPSNWIGLSYVKMFLDDEQEAFLRLKYEPKMIHDLTTK